MFSLEGGSTMDPDPDKCGFGTVDSVEIKIIEVPRSDWDAYDERRTAQDYPDG
jgi:hypothetical protein